MPSILQSSESVRITDGLAVSSFCFEFHSAGYMWSNIQDGGRKTWHSYWVLTLSFLSLQQFNHIYWYFNIFYLPFSLWILTFVMLKAVHRVTSFAKISVSAVVSFLVLLGICRIPWGMACSLSLGILTRSLWKRPGSWRMETKKTKETPDRGTPIQRIQVVSGLLVDKWNSGQRTELSCSLCCSSVLFFSTKAAPKQTPVAGICGDGCQWLPTKGRATQLNFLLERVSWVVNSLRHLPLYFYFGCLDFHSQGLRVNSQSNRCLFRWGAKTPILTFAFNVYQSEVSPIWSPRRHVLRKNLIEWQNL